MRITPTDVLNYEKFLDEVNNRAYSFTDLDLVKVEFDSEKELVIIHTDDTRSGSHHDKDTITVTYSEFFRSGELRELKIAKLL